jgi:hypothetical protein
MKPLMKRLILVACVLFVLPVMAFARDTTLPQVLDLGSGYSVSLPADWTISTNKDGAATVTSNDFGMTILAPTYVDALGLNLNAKSNVVNALIALDALPPNPITIKASDVQKVSYGSRTAAVYTYTIDSTTDGMDLVIPMGSGAPGYMALAANKGQFTAKSSTISAIITSFDKTSTSGTGSTTATGTEEAGASGAATGGGSEVNCTVSADSANSAQLRVGPGTNRGAISFLPVGIEVTVTGRIVLKDNSVWYQLDKNEAAPKGTSASELWVAATDITPSGDCEHVGDTSAPPVIPGNVAPPPSTNGTGNPGAGDQSAAPGSVPNPGRWTITYNPTTNISCQGTRNVPVDSNEVYASLTYVYFIQGVDANSFKYGGDLMTRIPGTNSFSGSFTFDDGTNMQARYDLVSPTLMAGQEVGNLVVDGTPCSGTVLVTLTRN